MAITTDMSRLKVEQLATVNQIIAIGQQLGASNESIGSDLIDNNYKGLELIIAMRTTE